LGARLGRNNAFLQLLNQEGGLALAALHTNGTEKGTLPLIIQPMQYHCIQPMEEGKMIRLNIKCNRIVLAFLAGISAVGQIAAHELGDFGQYPRGVTIGDSSAAPLPAGVYLENTDVFVPQSKGYGQIGGTKIGALVDIPTVVWATGRTFLGANVSMYLSQPAYELTTWNSAASGPQFAGATSYPTVANTWINPIALSWPIGSNWYAGVGFAVHTPDGASYNNTTNPDYWTYEPHATLSYLDGVWDLTAHLTYDFNTASAGRTGVLAGTPLALFGVGYRSGDQAFLEVTTTKKFGNWEIGPVAYFAWQTLADVPGGGYSCATLGAASQFAINCGRATDYAVGGLIGYDFYMATKDVVNVKLFFTDSYFTRDNVGGFAVWSKLSFKLWAPQTPVPPTSALIRK
jgi:hypothetical protein